MIINADNLRIVDEPIYRVERYETAGRAIEERTIVSGNPASTPPEGQPPVWRFTGFGMLQTSEHAPPVQFRFPIHADSLSDAFAKYREAAEEGVAEMQRMAARARQEAPRIVRPGTPQTRRGG